VRRRAGKPRSALLARRNLLAPEEVLQAVHEPHRRRAGASYGVRGGGRSAVQAVGGGGDRHRVEAVRRPGEREHQASEAAHGHESLSRESSDSGTEAAGHPVTHFSTPCDDGIERSPLLSGCRIFYQQCSAAGNGEKEKKMLWFISQ
jgi:hypothetical protein